VKREASAAKRNLEGEQSPGRIGFDGTSNGDVRIPDPKVEQGLEADARRNDALPSNGWSEPNGAANDKGATAAVTQYGYRRGISFGGYETALRGT
jgi:hypothetical protein